jgi:flagellar motor protein MotB
MNDMKNKVRLLVLALFWLGVVGVGVLGYKLWWAPAKEREKQVAAEQEHQDTLNKTSSSSLYTHTVNFAGDGFSGYAPIRSQTFKDECGKFGIRIDYKDDGANYTQRLKDLADGKMDMATFTIDALVKTSAEIGDFPVTVVALIDESKGADGLVAAGKQYPNIDALNVPNTKFVCVGNSPSETLCRVVMAHFNLDKLGKNPFEFMDSAEAVYKKYQTSKAGDNYVFAMWEPYISKVTDNPDYHVLVDSSKFRGYVVDVMVVRRSFLVKNEAVVENVVKSYLTTLFTHRNSMVDMVFEDAKANGEPVKKAQAEKLVKTIWWKNTQEAFGHFGFVRGSGLQPLEDICRNITDVQIRTGAVRDDPTKGHPNMWYYDGIMRKLFDSSWHPGFGNETVREEKRLAALTEEEWARMKPVGTLQVQRLVFARGTSKITDASEATLADLAEKLKAWPKYYLVVRGNASSDGDLEANLKLASDRAKSAVDWLTAHGVSSSRIRAESAKPNGSTTVAFVLGELPY